MKRDKTSLSEEWDRMDHPLDSKTIYTRYGDWFVWVSLIGSVVFLAAAALKARKKWFL
jgi:apolipoprotein N-acyltransferase